MVAIELLRTAVLALFCSVDPWCGADLWDATDIFEETLLDRETGADCGAALIEVKLSNENDGMMAVVRSANDT